MGDLIDYPECVHKGPIISYVSSGSPEGGAYLPASLVCDVQRYTAFSQSRRSIHAPWFHSCFISVQNELRCSYEGILQESWYLSLFLSHPVRILNSANIFQAKVIDLEKDLELC